MVQFLHHSINLHICLELFKINHWGKKERVGF